MTRRAPLGAAALGAAALGAVTLTIAACGGSSAQRSGPASTAPTTGTTQTAGTTAVASLGRQLEPCVDAWNDAANQTIRFAFDGEVLAARNTPGERMLVTRSGGRCSLVFAGSGAAGPRIWSQEAGVWSAQAVLAGETALTAEVELARVQPNVTAAITTPPDEEDTTVGLLVPLPQAG
jgi:ABC-type phosphate transport system substrate-binding protein